MRAIPLGKIAVATPGTPVVITLTAAQLALLSPTGQCHKIEVWADTADNAATFVKDAATGVKIAPLPAPSGSHCEHWQASAQEGNRINPLAFAVDAATATQGPIVTLWVI